MKNPMAFTLNEIEALALRAQPEVHLAVQEHISFLREYLESQQKAAVKSPRKERPENVQPEWLQKMVVGIAEARQFVCMLDGERFAIVKSPGSRWGDNSGTHYGAVEFMVVDKQHPDANRVGQGIMRASTSLKHGGRINKTHKDLFKQLVELTDRDEMLGMLKENGY